MYFQNLDFWASKLVFTCLSMHIYVMAPSEMWSYPGGESLDSETMNERANRNKDLRGTVIWTRFNKVWTLIEPRTYHFCRSFRRSLYLTVDIKHCSDERRRAGSRKCARLTSYVEDRAEFQDLLEEVRLPQESASKKPQSIYCNSSYFDHTSPLLVYDAEQALSTKSDVDHFAWIFPSPARG